MQRAADGERPEASSEELGVLVGRCRQMACGVEVARLGVVFGRLTPEPTAAPTCAVESEGGIEQSRRGPESPEPPGNAQNLKISACIDPKPVI